MYSTDVVAEEIEFAESKSSGNNSDTQTVPELPTDADGFMNVPDGIDEELPFN